MYVYIITTKIGYDSSIEDKLAEWGFFGVVEELPGPMPGYPGYGITKRWQYKAREELPGELEAEFKCSKHPFCGFTKVRTML